ncbi:MAG: 16S rRNA (cytidine(1402)-2'-O)-methyltransferase [Candidatus Omnitrophota bacterium]
MLYIVATPIGNLKDITLRAIEVLKEVDLIACEDTRHSRILLSAYGIHTPTTSYFQHNRFTKARYLLERMKGGAKVALISDAGTPGILDPGYHIINLAIQSNIPITVIPGATAFISALVLSGKPMHKFIFEGFLPKKSVARRKKLEELKNLNYTLVFYESCHRIMKSLEDIQAVFGDIPIVVVRELTKKFEEAIRFKVSQIREYLAKGKPRGEFVVVI